MGTSLTAGLQRKGVRIPEFAIGLLIVCVCIIGAFMWQNSGTEGTQVLVTSRALKRGHEIQATDLSTITLTSSDDIALLSTGAATDIIGMRLTTDIVPGSPLTLRNSSRLNHSHQPKVSLALPSRNLRLRPTSRRATTFKSLSLIRSRTVQTSPRQFQPTFKSGRSPNPMNSVATAQSLFALRSHRPANSSDTTKFIS